MNKPNFYRAEEPKAGFIYDAALQVQLEKEKEMQREGEIQREREEIERKERETQRGIERRDTEREAHRVNSSELFYCLTQLTRIITITTG